MAFHPGADVAFEAVFAHPPPEGDDPTVLRRLVQMIEDTPPGGSIHATIFRLTLDWVRDALIAANNRGVAVKVVHNGRGAADAVGSTLSRPAPVGLGDHHRWAGAPFDPSSATADYGGVATGRNADLHTKLILFSATKDPEGVLRDHVCWWSSANMSERSGTLLSNNALTVYGDPVLYDAFRTQLWALMWNGTHYARNDFYNGNRGRGTFLGGPATRTKVFCSPEQDTDLWVGRLRSLVVDDGASVDVAQVRFTDARTAVAEELVRIKAHGGAVRVLVGSNPAFLGATVRRTLLEADIPVRTGNIHDKLAVVHARHAMSTRRRKLVLSGSHNLNHDANYANDEILVKTFHDGLYDDLCVGHFEPIWATGAPVTEAAATTTDSRTLDPPEEAGPS